MIQLGVIDIGFFYQFTKCTENLISVSFSENMVDTKRGVYALARTSYSDDVVFELADMFSVVLLQPSVVAIAVSRCIQRETSEWPV